MWFYPIDTAPENHRVLIYSDDEMAMGWLDRIDRQWYHAPQGGLVQFVPTMWCKVPQPCILDKIRIEQQNDRRTLDRTLQTTDVG